MRGKFVVEGKVAGSDKKGHYSQGQMSSKSQHLSLFDKLSAASRADFYPKSQTTHVIIMLHHLTVHSDKYLSPSFTNTSKDKDVLVVNMSRYQSDACEVVGIFL